jgi:hypothetical protein
MKEVKLNRAVVILGAITFVVLLVAVGLLAYKYFSGQSSNPISPELASPTISTEEQSSKGLEELQQLEREFEKLKDKEKELEESVQEDLKYCEHLLKAQASGWERFRELLKEVQEFHFRN